MTQSSKTFRARYAKVNVEMQENTEVNLPAANVAMLILSLASFVACHWDKEVLVF